MHEVLDLINEVSELNGEVPDLTDGVVDLTCEVPDLIDGVPHLDHQLASLIAHLIDLIRRATHLTRDVADPVRHLPLVCAEETASRTTVWRNNQRALRRMMAGIRALRRTMTDGGRLGMP